MVRTEAPIAGTDFNITIIMFVAVIVILIVMLLGSVSALFAFSWAATHQQFENLEEAAKTIFDADEPIGIPTDNNIIYDHGS